MSNNKRRLQIAVPPTANISAQITITAFTDGRPPAVQCSTDPVSAMRLLMVGLVTAMNMIEQEKQPKKASADPVDKPRRYMGPRP